LIVTVFGFLMPEICAKSYYVNDGSTAGDVYTYSVGLAANDGTTTTTPKLSLKSLLTTYSVSIVSGDVIYIDAGTYANEVAITHTISGVSFIGAGPSKTIIDNGLAGAATNFFMYIYASNITLRDFTVKGYENSGTQTPGHSGQAITIGGGSSAISGILLQNMVVSNNGQSGGNPSISVLAKSTVTITAGGSVCNTAGTAYTGGVEAYGTSINLTILNYLFGNNYKDTGFDGGGLRIEGDNTTIVTVRKSKFSDNLATDGGAISQINGILNVYDCIFDNNSAGRTSTTCYGGAYRISAGTARFTRCKFINNKQSAGTLKGSAISAYYVNSGTFSTSNTISLTVDSSYFANNTPVGNGADIYAAESFSHPTNLTIRDCIFATTGISYNIVSNTATSISATYFGTAPSSNGSNITKTLSGNTSYTANPSTPTFTGSCASYTLLPIELTRFEGTCDNGNIILTWQTASESNNKNFNIERSMDGVNFQTIGIVEGLGNSTHYANYSFVDNEKMTGLFYYRLVQQDYNGKTHQSSVIVVNHECGENINPQILIYPNPSLSSSMISINVFRKSIVRIYIVNNLGQVVQSIKDQYLETGMQNFELNFDEVTAGVYFVKTVIDDKEYVNKFIKL